MKKRDEKEQEARQLKAAAQDGMKTKKPTRAELIAILLDVLQVGHSCANCCFNLGQDSDMRSRGVLKNCAKDWDAVVKRLPKLK